MLLKPVANLVDNPQTCERSDEMTRVADSMSRVEGSTAVCRVLVETKTKDENGQSNQREMGLVRRTRGAKGLAGSERSNRPG